MRRVLFTLLFVFGLSRLAFAADLNSLALGPELARLESGALVYVALASCGVAVVDTSVPSKPVLVGRFAEGRCVSRLIVDSGALVLFELREEATAWTLDDPRVPRRVVLGGQRVQVPAAPARSSAVPAPPTETPAPASPQPGAMKVVEVRGGRVLLEGGTRDGLLAGKHVRILSRRLERKPDLATGQMRDLPSGEVTAVLAIEEAQEERAMARLGRGDTAEVGDVAELTGEPLSQRLILPRRSLFGWLLGFQVRPFLGLEASTVEGQRSKPVGFLVDLYATAYVPGLPLAVTASVAPVGFAFGALQQHYPVTFSATAAYALDYFEIGLGAGGLVGSPGPCTQFDPGAELTCEVNTGFTINQVLRLGSLDGLNISWRSSIFSRPDRFVFGTGRGELNVPLTSSLGLFAGGGAGENGWGFGEFGVRTYVNGVGARGTVILSASLGYSAIFDSPARETVGGPSVALGGEWRL